MQNIIGNLGHCFLNFAPSFCAMKKLTAISLAVLIFAATAKDMLMWASFKVNQDFIAKTLCINQDKPEKLCSGKCFLTKKISEEKKAEKSTVPMPSPDESKQVVYYQAIVQAEFSGLIATFQKTFFKEITFAGQSCLADIFQPPRALQLS